MRHVTWCAMFAGVALTFMAGAPAHAQATRTWVSGVGDDVNPCSRTAPCKTYAGAISKTAVNGEINCLDPGGFGTLTITKSISIVCDYTEGGVLSAGVNGFIINAPAGSIVTLKGQDIECAGSGLNGIRIINAAVIVHVHKVQIRNCRGSNGNGISLANTSGAAELYVSDSYITDNGTGPTVGGILVAPTGSGSAVVAINNVKIENNRVGVRFDASATSGSIQAAVRDSVVAGNTNNGVTAISGTGAATVMVDRSSIVGNAFGLVVNGNSATIFSNQTSITGNGTGLFVSGTGTLASYKNNAVNGNGTDGAFTSLITPQ